MASSISIESLLREKKYPFIVSFVILIGCVSVILFTTTPRYVYPSSSSDTDIQTNRHSISDSEQQSQQSLNHSSSSSSSSPPPLSISNPPPPPLAPPDDVDKATDTAVASTGTDTDDQHRHQQQQQSDEISWNSDNPNWEWEICTMSRASDFVPCLDNMKAIKSLKSRRHMEHRERHCPQPSLRCLVPLPKGYKIPITWPMSRDMIWYDNVPHPKLVDYKKGQNWVTRSGNHFVFPGGGTQFKEGVAKYIEFIQKTFSSIKWGKHTRVILDVGCGVASFGGYLLDKDVIAMSFAPKDEHEAQIQFALERGIPAILSVIGTQRLNFPDNAYDLIHCARCRVHWDADGGQPLLELNRILRPGGLFVWSATPVYRDDTRDLNVWNAMVTVTKSLCWKQVAKTVDSSGIGLVVYQKPVSNSCYEGRKEKNPPLCDEKERHNTSWYLPLGSCLPKLSSREVNWPAPWPERLTSKPQSLALESTAAEIYYEDTKHWSVLVSEVYLDGLAINWSSIRNVMDMNAGYGGFAAALVDHPLWVMNVVPINTPDTLAVIFDRGLIGTYHDWCEPFNTYPRTYDLLHANYLFGNLTKRCEIVDVAVEIDRILRPGGWLLVQDNMEMVTKLTHLLASLHWETTFYQGHFLLGKKGFWRPRKRD